MWPCLKKNIEGSISRPILFIAFFGRINFEESSLTRKDGLQGGMGMWGDRFLRDGKHLGMQEVNEGIGDGMRVGLIEVSTAYLI